MRFPADDTGCLFSYTWQYRFHIFPALGTVCMISRAWHQLHVFPHLTLDSFFPALGSGCMSSRAWHRLHVFPRLAACSVSSFDWLNQLLPLDKDQRRFTRFGPCCIGINHLSENLLGRLGSCVLTKSVILLPILAEMIELHRSTVSAEFDRVC